MDTTPTLTAAEVIDRVQACRRTAHQAAVDEVELVVEWARLHPCPDGEWPAQWSEPTLAGDTIRPLAGTGAPLVAEFAPLELAAALGITPEAGKRLVAESLELVHRLPRLWCAVKAGMVPVWKARAIAALTHDLGLEAIAYADRMLAATPDKLRLVDATRLVEEARLYFDPDRAAAEEEHQLQKRGVWVSRRGTGPATTDVFMTLETPDALLFDQTVTRIAADLAALGDTEDLDHRRATAVGILADPQHALDLMSGCEGAAPTMGREGALNLYLHLTPEDLLGDLGTDGIGAVSIEKLGAATTQLLTDWLARQTSSGGKVTLRPVVYLTDPAAPESRPVDQHDPPAAMRELVFLRDAHCVFPGCRHDSRGCDLDHITPYVPMDEGGPPGQTHPGNLAPLCRTHHRIKTHTPWDYKRTDDGTYTWMSPTGHQYDVISVSRRPPARRT